MKTTVGFTVALVAAGLYVLFHGTTAYLGMVLIVALASFVGGLFAFGKRLLNSEVLVAVVVTTGFYGVVFKYLLTPHPQLAPFVTWWWPWWLFLLFLGVVAKVVYTASKVAKEEVRWPDEIARWDNHLEVATLPMLVASGMVFFFEATRYLPQAVALLRQFPFPKELVIILGGAAGTIRVVADASVPFIVMFLPTFYYACVLVVLFFIWDVIRKPRRTNAETS